MTLPDPDHGWRTSHYGAVHEVLIRFHDSGVRHPPPGAEGVIGRAQLHCARRGDRAALDLLDAISVNLFRLRQALLARADTEFAAAERALIDLSKTWLLNAPMFPDEAALTRAA